MESKPDRYSSIAIILHWTVALLILVQFSLGWYMVDLPKGTERSDLFALHKSIGLSILLLASVRLVWRLTHNLPPLPTTMPRWQRELALHTHIMLYLLLFLQPLSGYLSSSFSGYKTSFFGIPLPHWGWKDLVLNELFTALHVVSSITLLLLIIAHTLGALLHALTPEDHVFRRMLPLKDWLG